MRCSDQSTQMTTSQMVASTFSPRCARAVVPPPAAPHPPGGARSLQGQARAGRFRRCRRGSSSRPAKSRASAAARASPRRRRCTPTAMHQPPVPELRRFIRHRHDAEAGRAAAARRQQEAADDLRQPAAQERHQIAQHDLAQQRRPGEAQEGADAADGERTAPSRWRRQVVPSSRAAGRRRSGISLAMIQLRNPVVSHQ